MEVLTIDLPAMYGDHHVTEVRRLLLEIPGVEDIYASSCFQAVQLRYDPERIDSAAIQACLAEAGYLTDLDMPRETSLMGPSRHTVAYPQTGRVIGFAQAIDAAKENPHGEERA